MQTLHKGSDKDSLLMRPHFEFLDYRLQRTKNKKRFAFVIGIQILYILGKPSASQLQATIIKISLFLKMCPLPYEAQCMRFLSLESPLSVTLLFQLFPLNYVLITYED